MPTPWVLSDAIEITTQTANNGDSAEDSGDVHNASEHDSDGRLVRG